MKKPITTLIATLALAGAFILSAETIEKSEQTLFGVPYKFGWQTWEPTQEDIARLRANAPKQYEHELRADMRVYDLSEDVRSELLSTCKGVDFREWRYHPKR